MKIVRMVGAIFLSMGGISLVMGQMYKPDNLIALNSNLSDTVGADIYNTDGANQTKEDTVALEHTAVFYIKIENDGTASDVIRVTGPAGDASWDIRYYNDLLGGADITFQVTTAGWSPPALDPGTGFAYFRVEITPDTSVQGGTTKDVRITSTSIHEPYPEDVVLARVTAHRFQPDNIIAGNIDGSDYIGKSIYNATGENQTKEKSIPPANMVTYYIKIENDGTIQDSFSITGDGSDPSWDVKYFNAYTGGADITGAITGPGWHTPELAPEDSVKVRVEVTPAPDVPGGGKKEVLVTSASLNFPNRKDAVKMVTTVPAYQPDLIIANKFDMSDGVGDNIYNPDAHDQTKAQQMEPGDTAYYYVEIQNDGTDNDVINVNAPSPKYGWTVYYYENSTDITSQIINPPGWFTNVLPGGGSTRIKIEVIPAGSLTPGEVDSILIASTSQMDPTKNDVVMAVAEVQKFQPDNWIALEKDFSDQVGEGIINTTGENQTKGVAVLPGERATFYIRVENKGSIPDSFDITATPSIPGWTIAYYDSTEGGNLIKMPWGIVLDTLAYKDIRAVVTPEVLGEREDTLMLMFMSTSTLKDEKSDVVKAVTVKKKPGIAENRVTMPKHFEMEALSSNPSRNALLLSYAVPRTSRVSIRIYDITGKVITSLVSELKKPGVYEAKWDTETISAGIYFYKMEAEGFSTTKKFVKLR